MGISTLHLCCHCSALPALDHYRPGREERCPLCKCEQLVVGSAKYRLRDDDGEFLDFPAPAHAGHGPGWIILGIAGALAAGIAILVVVLANQTPEQKAAPAPVAVKPPQQDAASPAAARAAPEVLQEPAPFEEPLSSVKDRGNQGVWSAQAKPSGVPPIIPPKGPNGNPPADDSSKKPSRSINQIAALYASENVDGLLKELQAMPEIALDQERPKLARPEDFRKHMKEWTALIAEKNKKRIDGFVDHVKETRADLRGLPFIPAPACELSFKEAVRLQEGSGLVRTLLDRAAKDSLLGLGYGMHRNQMSRENIVPALAQILDGAVANHRWQKVDYLKGVVGKEATRVLVRSAMYDPAQEVRHAAREALRGRPVQEVDSLLLEGLRYPWAPVARHAAQTIAYLNRDDLIPQLIDALEAPDPSEPCLIEADGKRVPAQREIVRLNHHRNCLLCHAVLNDGEERTRERQLRDRDLPLGPVPSPLEPFPRSFRAYYAERNGETIVRADVTYLRQDFSMLLPVENAKPWPSEQRYDFLVRTRLLEGQELARWKNGEMNLAKDAVTLHRQAILQALRYLTDQDLGPSPAQWRSALRELLPQDRVWRSPCAK